MNKLTTQEADNILFTMMQATFSDEKQESDRVKVIVDDIYSLKTIIKYANLIFDNSEVDNIMITVRSNIVIEHTDEIAELFSYYETILTLNCETLENGKTASYIKILIYKKKGE